jgi:hypothetical protein
MTNEALARSYLEKATDRLDSLDVSTKKGAYSDVVQEAQEIVELALKGMLRAVGIERPKLHDVGDLLLAYRDRFPGDLAGRLEELAAISKALREERELACYGEVDVIPTEASSLADARQASNGALQAVEVAWRVIERLSTM